MNWQAGMSWDVAQERNKLYQRIRSFFNERNVIEVETPLLCQGTITDLHIDTFSTKYNFLENEEKTLFLQTSPEFCMKRLLASGYGDIFQLCKAFRDEPHGKYHNPEFTILEWYRLGYDHFDLMKEVEEFLQCTLKCEAAEYISYQALFIKHTGIDPLTANISELKQFLMSIHKLDDWLVDIVNLDTLLQFIFAECIEVIIGKIAPCFVYGFPRTQASLAKISKDDKRIADRFECYFKGIELVNGFNELTDAESQRIRFDDDNVLRKNSNMIEKPIDEKFIAALNYGLPQCAGVALGIDRLFMILMNIKNIETAITFNIDKA